MLNLSKSNILQYLLSNYFGVETTQPRMVLHNHFKEVLTSRIWLCCAMVNSVDAGSTKHESRDKAVSGAALRHLNL